MRSKPLQRRTPLRAKLPPPRPCKVIDYTPTPRPTARAAAPLPMARPVPKEEPIRDKSYLRWVATLPCAHCGVIGFSQAAHADEGKGLAIKACDSTCYPACGPRPGVPGCHWIIGSSGTYPREERRKLEQAYAAATRARLGVDERLQPRLATDESTGSGKFGGDELSPNNSRARAFSLGGD